MDRGIGRSLLYALDPVRWGSAVIASSLGGATISVVAAVWIVASGLAAVWIVASGLAAKDSGTSMLAAASFVASGLAAVWIVASGLAAGHFQA